MSAHLPTPTPTRFEPDARAALRHGVLLMAALCAGVAAGLLFSPPPGVALWLGAPEAVAPKPGAAPAERSRELRLDVLSEPQGAEIFVDAVYVGRTPVLALPVRLGPGGRLALELRRGGYRPLRQELVIGPELERLRLPLALEALNPTD